MNQRVEYQSGKSGMTLIELVVVLALLAGLAAMALTGVADLGMRGRYDETTARMKLIRQAVAGDGAEVGRFVRDMGRRPIMHHTNEGVRLEELWRDEGVIGYGMVTNDKVWPVSHSNLYSYGEVKLVCGWNGPYLMVDDPDDAESYDGFGNPWGVYTNSAGEVTNVVSYGSDNDVGGTEWDEEDRKIDFGALLPKTELTVVVKGRASTNAGDVAWSLVEDAGGSTNAQPCQLDLLVVGLFTPDIDENDRALKRRTNNWSLVESQTTFSGLVPTDCLIYGYGTNVVTGLQVSGGGPELLRLWPGRNTVTLYLREP